jgi:adenine-specific DNA-methyltransferase
MRTAPARIASVWSGSPTSTNRLYFGDNLPILAALLQDALVSQKVKLIYIDPPYATNSVFHSRTQADAYQDLLVGPHYIEFMRQRLILLHELLADDGSIYVHLDETMAFYVKIIMDEIFGARNFRNWITRRKCNPKNTTRKRYGDISDYVLFYSKTDHYVWNRPVEEWTDERATKEYTNVEPGTGRRYKKVPVHAPGTRNGATGGLWKGRYPPPGKHWQFTPDILDEMDARGEIYWSPNGNPRRKIYLDDSAGVPVQDIWLDFPDVRNQNTRITGYPTEKSPALLDRIIRASSEPGDWVLDCFAGSGTALAEASRLNRHWIGIDNSPEAIATILRRFKIGVEPMGDFVGKRGKRQEVALDTLFSLIEPDDEDESRSSLRPPHVISDFTLYSSASDAPQIMPTITDWQKQ